MPRYDNKTNVKGTTNKTKEYAKKAKKKTTYKDVPGSGMAKKAAKSLTEAMKRRKKMMDSY